MSGILTALASVERKSWLGARAPTESGDSLELEPEFEKGEHLPLRVVSSLLTVEEDRDRQH